MNPFYLTADFDGDGTLDYALSIVDKKSKKKGILLYHTGPKKYFVFGANSPRKLVETDGEIRHPNVDYDYYYINAWKIHRRDKKVEVGAGEEKLIKLIGDALRIIKLEAASGLIYWDGKQYRWYQQGD